MNQQSPIDGSTKSAISLRDIVISIYRRKWVVLAIALPIILVGGMGLFNQSASYVGTARVLVELSNVDQPRWDVTGKFIDYDRELSTMLNIAMSVPVAQMAVESLQDSLSIIRGLDPVLADLGGGDDLATYLLEGTDVSVVGESRILEFRFNASHPRLALMSVDAMRTAFMDYHVHGQKNDQSIAYYEEQIGIVRSNVDSLLSERSTILEQSGYSEMREELRVEAGSLVEAKYKLVEARIARRTVEIEYEGLQLALEGDPREFPMGKTESTSASLVHWRRLATQHEDKLNTLRSIHTENSVPVIQQRELLESSLEKLKREEQGYVESVMISLEGLRAKERMLEDLVSTLSERRASAPQAYYRISLIDAEVNSLRSLMETLQGKLGEVRISQQADERVSAIVALTQPELARLFGGGKSIIYFLLLSFFAIAMGIIAVFALEMLDHRISSPSDIEERLNLPVLASIPKVK